MSKLPYNRVVNVNLTRIDQFPDRRGFGTPLFLSSVAVNGIIDASNRTKLYGSIEEIAVDHATSTDVYKAALVYFSQNPRPVQMKVGFIALDSNPIASEVQTQLDTIYAADPDWYMLTHDTSLRDIAAADGILAWIQAKNKIALLDSADAGMLAQNNTTSIAARNKGIYDRGAVFFNESDDTFVAMGAAAYMATRDFDQADSHYTLKFKSIKGLAPQNIASAGLTALTGFTPGVGQSEVAGHMANAYIDIGGEDFITEGSTLTPNVFIDEIHATDWIIARTEEEMLAVLRNNARVKFDDSGMELLATAPKIVMQQATRAGMIADDLDPETGEYAPAIVYTIPSALSVPASQRVNRIAPAIRVDFRYAGAVHYATVNFNMYF